MSQIQAKQEIRLTESLTLWICGFIILALGFYSSENIFTTFTASLNTTLVYAVSALIVCSTVYIISLLFPAQYRAYIIILTIPIASAIGLTATMTGGQAEKQNKFLYGLSFYAATVAYTAKNNWCKRQNLLIASNPALLATGPIALSITRIKHKKLKQRISYYYPFFVVGVFFHQIISTPLTKVFFYFYKTDLVSVCFFTVCFEIFMYTNFAGLSLILYSLFGVLGYRIPINFRQPFSSRNIIEFWRGWHTSLSSTLKQLFYTPLKGKFNSEIAIIAVFLSSAVWHGISANFFLWGAFHASAFLVSRYLLIKGLRFPLPAIHVIAVIIGRLIFSESDFNRLIEKCRFHYTNFNTLMDFTKLPHSTILALGLGITLIACEYIYFQNKMFAKRNYRFLRNQPVFITITIITALALQQNGGLNFAAYGQR